MYSYHSELEECVTRIFLKDGSNQKSSQEESLS